MASVHDENHAKTIAKFRRFWVEEPRHKETISSDENCYLYCSTRETTTNTYLRTRHISGCRREQKRQQKEVYICTTPVVGGTEELAGLNDDRHNQVQTCPARRLSLCSFKL